MLLSIKSTDDIFHDIFDERIDAYRRYFRTVMCKWNETNERLSKNPRGNSLASISI